MREKKCTQERHSFTALKAIYFDLYVPTWKRKKATTLISRCCWCIESTLKKWNLINWQVGSSVKLLKFVFLFIFQYRWQSLIKNNTIGQFISCSHYFALFIFTIWMYNYRQLLSKLQQNEYKNQQQQQQQTPKSTDRNFIQNNKTE